MHTHSQAISDKQPGYSYIRQARRLRELERFTDDHNVRQASWLRNLLAMTNTAHVAYGVPKDTFLHLLRVTEGDLCENSLDDLCELHRARKGLARCASNAAQTIAAVEEEMRFTAECPSYYVLQEGMKDRGGWFQAIREHSGESFGQTEQEAAERVAFTFTSWLPHMLSQSENGKRPETSWYLSAICRAAAIGGDELALKLSLALQDRLSEDPEDIRLEGLQNARPRELAGIMTFPTPKELRRLHDLRDTFEPVLRDLQELYLHEAERLLTLLPGISIGNPESIRAVVARLERLRELGHPVPVIVALTASLEAHERLEFLELCEDYPDLTSLFRNLKRRGLAADSFASFMLEVGQEGGIAGRSLSLYDEIALVAEQASTAQNAAFLVNHSHSLLHSSEAGRILDLARAYPNAYVIFDDFMAALDSDSPVRAELLLQIAAAAPEGNELKNIRQAMSGETEASLQSYLGLEPEALIQRLVSSARRKVAPPADTPGRKRIDPDEAFREELLMAGEAYHKAYCSLALNASPRFQALSRYVWGTAPSSFMGFCHDAERITDRQHLLLLLSDRVLLRMYLRKLPEPGFDIAEVLKRSGASLLGNTSAIRAELRSSPDTAYAETEATVQTDAINAHISVPKGIFERVVVFGGYYRGTKTQKLTDAAEGLHLILNDSVNWDVLPTYVRPNDLLIVNTRGIGHPEYFKLKRICASRGTTVQHFSFLGYQALSALLRQLERSPGRQ